jgi:hypothetical protein
MIPAITAGDVRALCFGVRVVVVASSDAHARRVEMDNAGGKSQGLGSGGRQVVVAFGHPVGIARIQDPTAGIIVELCGGYAGRNALVGGHLVDEAEGQVEGLMAQPQTIQHHNVDGFTHGEIAHFRLL